jgi:hypothetical protein
MGQEMKSAMEVTAYETNSKWAAKVLKGPVPYEVTATFVPEGSGTRMTTVVEGEPKGFFKVAEGMMKGQLEGPPGRWREVESCWKARTSLQRYGDCLAVR